MKKKINNGDARWVQRLSTAFGNKEARADTYTGAAANKPSLREISAYYQPK